jgi:bifunctional DNA primase/polymerase-like protein/primase-like protein
LEGVAVVDNSPRSDRIANPFDLRTAVRAAIRAYKKTGHMRDAALAYGAHGFPVFPLSAGSKRPIPPRDPDPTGQYPKGIPGSGGVYKATTDPDIIRRWWTLNPQALIGLPMGKRTGVWTLDVDTGEDHADGTAAWNEIIAEHEPLVTREHRSATDGPHLIFKCNAEQIGCSKGALPSGIEVRGQGGYIAVPPSRRKQRNYTVHHDIDPVEAPQWLVNLILQDRPQASSWTPRAPVSIEKEIERLADALQFVPNPDDWVEWKNNAMRIFAGVGDAGFEPFAIWSRRWKRYKPSDEADIRQCWEEVRGCPPSRTGINKIYKIARANGWVPKTEPTYPAEENPTADEARRKLVTIIRDFLHGVLFGFPPNPWVDFYFMCRGVNTPPDTWAARVATGTGKTQLSIKELAVLIKKLIKEQTGTIIYSVPTHKLSKEIETQFGEHGVSARVFRGRMAIDPDDPEKRRQMCLNPVAVKKAMECGADITKTCCKHGSKVCAFFKQCAYQKQMPKEMPSVWIIAHDMLFHYVKAFGNPIMVIIDESFWQKGIVGMHESDEVVLRLDGISNKATELQDGNLAALRDRLVETLLMQEHDGGVVREHLDAVFNDPTNRLSDIGWAIRREWDHLGRLKIGLEPGMSEDEIAALDVTAIRHSRDMIRIWEDVLNLINNFEISVSGRLTLLHESRRRCIQWRGVSRINRKFIGPTLLIDATLPAPSILEIYHPRAEVVADIGVAMPPHVRIKQILNAPTTSRKLNSASHLMELRRHVLQSWMQYGRQRTLVITQKKAADWLMESKLPESISIEHYNAIGGLDAYRDVRLMILAGRTAPGPQAMEVLAGIMTGAQPVLIASGPSGFSWYGPAVHGIRLADGSGLAVDADRHPDPVVEDIRWLICEAELIQALGRARGINRTSELPLDIELLFNNVLPVTVAVVTNWEIPSLLIETAVEGVMLTAPVDMVRAWPKLWPNEKAADRTLKEGVQALPGFVEVTYQLVGAKKKRRRGWFSPDIDPESWIKDRLGPVASVKPL